MSKRHKRTDLLDGLHEEARGLQVENDPVALEGRVRHVVDELHRGCVHSDYMQLLFQIRMRLIGTEEHSAVS